jgi:hypothetical protein
MILRRVGLMAKGQWIELFVAKKRDVKAIKALAKHLNQGTGGQRAARTKRKKVAKKVAHDPS